MITLTTAFVLGLLCGAALGVTFMILWIYFDGIMEDNKHVRNNRNSRRYY